MLDIVANFGAVLTGLGAGWIVWLGHQLARRQRADAWLENLNHLHGQFWEDPDFAEVREWLASDAAYVALRESIEVRFLRPAHLSRDDYRRIDLLDKFFNFLIRVRLVDSQLDADRDLWGEMSFSFWLEVIGKHDRWHLWVYCKHFFGETRIGRLLSTPEERAASEALLNIRNRLLPQPAP